MSTSLKYNYKRPVVELDSSRKVGQTGVFRSALCPETLIGLDPSQPNTLYEIVEAAFREASDNPFLGKRIVDEKTGELGDYSYLTYKEVHNQVNEVGSGLINLARETLGLPNERNWNLGIFSCNRTEWSLSDLAAVTQNLVTVALFDTYGQDALEYVIDHAELPLIVASANYIHRLLLGAERLPKLKIIVSMDPIPVKPAPGSIPHLLKTWAASVNIQLMDFDQLRELGRKNPVPHSAPSHDDVYTICYTSGTTGQPKGAVCTHLNYASAIRGVQMATGRTRNHTNIAVSYLPAAHCFERCSFYFLVYLRGQLGFYSGDILKLAEDLAILKPTIMASVPRLLNRIYDRVALQTIHGHGLGPALFRVGLQSKMSSYLSGGGNTHGIWDSLVFSKVRAVLGGRVEQIITGSAPIDPKVLDFLRVSLSCEIFDGYGATETCAALSISIPGEYRSGSVGAPMPCCEVKLIDVPEMGYLATDQPHPRGEICVRGSNIFKGYYKSPEQTEAALDSDGWYYTGDIALLDKRHLIKIIDRKKNIFKLSQGEYVAPEKIEGVYSSHPLIMQIFVFGDSLQPHLVGIVVPDPEAFLPWAREKFGNSANSTGSELELAHYCRDPQVNAAIVKELADQATKGKLNGFERVHAIHMEPEPFSADNGFITPTFKLKRHEISKHYKPIIQALYDNPSPPARL